MSDERDAIIMQLVTEVALLRSVVAHLVNETIPENEVPGIIEMLDIPALPPGIVDPTGGEITDHFVRATDKLAEALSDDRIRRRKRR